MIIKKKKKKNAFSLSLSLPLPLLPYPLPPSLSFPPSSLPSPHLSQAHLFIPSAKYTQTNTLSLTHPSIQRKQASKQERIKHASKPQTRTHKYSEL